jgi:hypothetical protein
VYYATLPEDLGLESKVGRLLVVDWVPPEPDGRPALEDHVFDGGVLDNAQIAPCDSTSAS